MAPKEQERALLAAVENEGLLPKLEYWLQLWQTRQYTTSTLIGDLYDCLVDLDIEPSEMYKNALDRIPDSALRGVSREVLACFQDALLNSPFSPFGRLMPPDPPQKIPIVQQTLKTVQKAVMDKPPTAKGPKKISRSFSIHKSPEELESESLRLRHLNEARDVAAVFTISRKARMKRAKQLATSAIEWISEQGAREKKKSQIVERHQRHIAKQICAGVTRFWRVASTIALRRLKHNLRGELSKVRAEKQMAWVKRAEKYAVRLAARLQESRRERGLEPQSSSDSEVSEDASEWSEQEEEDAKLEAEMSSASGEEEEIDEVARLKEESMMDLDALLAKIKAQEETTMAPPAKGVDTGPSPKRGRLAERRRRQKLARQRRARGGDDPDSSESEPDTVEPSQPEPEPEPEPAPAPKRGSRAKPVKLEPTEPTTSTVAPPRKRPIGKVKQGPVKKAKVDPTQVEEEASVKLVEISSLLRATLRPYQHAGVDWLVSLHDCEINGILADEMGLGKTIQSIALLAYLASVRGIWGPHLVIVPTSVVINWEVEFRKFAPGLKVLTYFGSKKDRAKKRQGWQKPWAFNVCVTSYTLALADAVAFRRVSWYYLILDEAQNLKNSQTARWQTLLKFNAERRLLLTGTPLQNNLMELWSLMYFLMPEVFGTHTEWRELFDEPLTTAIEKSQLKHETIMIRHLYRVLRPFLCRRLKKDVESQMPQKVEHVIKCELSKRQKLLYDELMTASTKTGVFEVGEYLAIMNVLMQLRKVCNHPDLLEDTNIHTAIFDDGLQVAVDIPNQCMMWNWDRVNKPVQELSKTLSPEAHPIFSILKTNIEQPQSSYARGGELRPGAKPQIGGMASVHLPSRLLEQRESLFSSLDPDANHTVFTFAKNRLKCRSVNADTIENLMMFDPWIRAVRQREDAEFKRRRRGPDIQKWVYPPTLNFVAPDLRSLVLKQSSVETGDSRFNPHQWYRPHLPLHDILDGKTPSFNPLIEEILPSEASKIFPEFRASAARFKLRLQCPFLTTGPRVDIRGKGGDLLLRHEIGQSDETRKWLVDNAIRSSEYIWGLDAQVLLPSRRNVEFDAGKLGLMTPLLYAQQRENRKCIIFTQMSRMLDVLERYLNIHGFTYVRLDGGTKPERRQQLVDKFNNDPRVFLFIASSRAGGVGINLTGGSVVIFYDTDWNPAMDRQAMDRCHRLGQTRDVHVYRFITASTIEENIWRKQLQKRLLDDVVVDQGKFSDSNVALFNQADVRDLLFTVDSTDDLYQTRVLHDQTALGDQMLRDIEEGKLAPEIEETAEEDLTIVGQIQENQFETVLAQVEDQEDAVAFKGAKRELTKDALEFRREFGVTTSSVEGASIVSPDDGSEVVPLSTELNVPLFVDAAAGSLMVSPAVHYAVGFIETVVPTRAMQQETFSIQEQLVKAEEPPPKESAPGEEEELSDIAEEDDEAESA